VSAQETLDERYGARRGPSRRTLVVVATVLAVAFLGWLAWVIAVETTPEVTSELETFSIDGDHSATAVLLVKLADADVQAQCTLRAYAEDHTTVGELTFEPDPSTRRQTQQVRTERKATSVEKVGCTAPGQDRAR
jgi:hypothetical protein